MDADAVFSRWNPLVSGILRTPVLHWLLSPGLVLLTVTGRRTGRRYSIPVGFQRDGDRLSVLVSKAPRKQWWRNFREPREIELHLRGKARRGRARALAPDSDEFRFQTERTLRRLPFLAGQFGIEYDRKSGLGEEQWKMLQSEIAVVQIDLER